MLNSTTMSSAQITSKAMSNPTSSCHLIHPSIVSIVGIAFLCQSHPYGRPNVSARTSHEGMNHGSCWKCAWRLLFDFFTFCKKLANEYSLPLSKLRCEHEVRVICPTRSVAKSSLLQQELLPLTIADGIRQAIHPIFSTAKARWFKI